MSTRKKTAAKKRPQRKKGKNRRGRRFLRLVVILILLPLILWGLVNLFFASSWGTGIAAKAVGKKLGFPCEIDRLSWSPWNGGRAFGFRVLVPVDVGPGGEAALVEVREARVWPDWHDVFRGNLDFTSTDIEDVEVTLGIETLKDLSAGKLRGISTLPEEKSAAAEKPKPEPAPKPAKKAKKPPEKKPSRPGKKKKNPAPAPAEKAEKQATHFIHIKNLNLRLLGDSQKTLLSLNGLNLDLPLGGNGQVGRLRFSSLNIAGQKILGDGDIPLQCRGRDIEIDFTRDVLGLKANLQAMCSLRDGLPLLADLTVPKQAAEFADLPYGFPAFSVEEFEQHHRFKGLALHPTTWTATSLGGYRGITGHDPEDGSAFVFERGDHVAGLQGGVLNLADFRMIGEEDSVLGNGKLALNGQVAATVRLVTTTERGREHHNRVKRMARTRKRKIQLRFKSLGIPERVYHDLHLHGDLTHPLVDMGEGEKDVPLRDVLETLFYLHLPAMKSAQ